MKITSLLSVLTLCFCASSYAQVWSRVGKGIKSQLKNENNNIHALCVYKNKLYAGGTFTQAGNVEANFIAVWDGSKWSDVGKGMNGMVNSLCIYKDELYASGWFTAAGGQKANRIAKWNDTSWSTLGSGMDFHPNILTVYKEDLYAAGEFTLAGGMPANNIAKWNGSNWSPLEKGVDAVFQLKEYKGELYSGGYAFTKNNGFSKWNGSSWSMNVDDLHGLPYSMEIYNDELYIGGYFPAKDKLPEVSIVKWDGKKLKTVGTKGTDGHVFALFNYGGVLYAGGFFNNVDGLPANNMAIWNGVKWKAFTPGFDLHPHSFIIYKEKFYAAGGYSSSECDVTGKEMIYSIPVSYLNISKK